MYVNDIETGYGNPVPAGERTWLMLEASETEIAQIVGLLAGDSIEFTFDPYPDDQYEITVKADQRHHVEKLLGIGS